MQFKSLPDVLQTALLCPFLTSQSLLSPFWMSSPTGWLFSRFPSCVSNLGTGKHGGGGVSRLESLWFGAGFFVLAGERYYLAMGLVNFIRVPMTRKAIWFFPASSCYVSCLIHRGNFCSCVACSCLIFGGVGDVSDFALGLSASTECFWMLHSSLPSRNRPTLKVVLDNECITIVSGVVVYIPHQVGCARCIILSAVSECNCLPYKKATYLKQLNKFCGWLFATLQTVPLWDKMT